jgi:transcriptional regulator with XRE-family HTH domain
VRQDTIGARLAYARKTIGVNIDAFSAITDIPISSLKKYESDHRVPGGEAIQSTAKAGINAHWLVTGHGPMLIKDLYSSENNVENNDLENVSLSDEDLARFKTATQKIIDAYPGDVAAICSALTIELSIAYGINKGAIDRIIEVSRALEHRKK